MVAVVLDVAEAATMPLRSEGPHGQTLWQGGEAKVARQHADGVESTYHQCHFLPSTMQGFEWPCADPNCADLFRSVIRIGTQIHVGASVENAWAWTSSSLEDKPTFHVL